MTSFRRLFCSLRDGVIGRTGRRQKKKNIYIPFTRTGLFPDQLTISYVEISVKEMITDRTRSSLCKRTELLKEKTNFYYQVPPKKNKKGFIKTLIH